LAFLAFAAFTITLAEVSARVYAHRVGVSIDLIVEQTIMPARFLVIGLCALIGGIMIPRAHPLTDREYLRWLMTTPWNPRMPLPLGDPFLTMTDLVYLAAIEIAGVALVRFPPGVMFTIFALGFILSAVPQLASTKQKWLAFGVFASAGLMPVLWQPKPLICIAIVLVDFVVCMWGLRRSLRDYPWGRDQSKRPTIDLGWPIGRVGPVEIAEPIPTRNVVAWSALIAWWLYIFMRSADAKSVLATQIVVAGAGCLFALFRLSIYTGSKHAPITLFGRILAGHWFIPRYDIVYFGPIVSSIVAVGAPFGLMAAGLPRVQAIPVTVFLLLFSLFAVGPSRRMFDLCGAYRLISIRDRHRTGVRV
jgi:hypothetical protein